MAWITIISSRGQPCLVKLSLFPHRWILQIIRIAKSCTLRRHKQGNETRLMQGGTRDDPKGNSPSPRGSHPFYAQMFGGQCTLPIILISKGIGRVCTPWVSCAYRTPYVWYGPKITIRLSAAPPLHDRSPCGKQWSSHQWERRGSGIIDQDSRRIPVCS
jgi:hypothetical protein